MSTLHRLQTRWNRNADARAEGSSSLRFAVCPPSLRQAPESLLNRIWFWLAASEPRDASPPIQRLPSLRQEFQAALTDVSPSRAAELMHRIECARSLRELWHLRADVYGLVALELSQAEAENRLDTLNRHFSSGAPRPDLARP